MMLFYEALLWVLDSPQTNLMRKEIPAVEKGIKQESSFSIKNIFLGSASMTINIKTKW